MLSPSTGHFRMDAVPGSIAQCDRAAQAFMADSPCRFTANASQFQLRRKKTNQQEAWWLKDRRINNCYVYSRITDCIVPHGWRGKPTDKSP